MGGLRIGLFDPGMTTLHRVGLAGFWMTLEELERKEPGTVAALEAAGGRWRREPAAVELSWTGDGRGFFDQLFEASFRLTEDGRIWLTGAGHPDDSPDGGATLQAALLSTYLQHGRHRGADPQKRPSGSLVRTIDNAQVPVRYRKVGWYQHQRAAEQFRPDQPSPVKGWLFPGGAVRHAGYETATELTEPPGRWLALLYAPVATFYFSVRRSGTAVRPSFCLALAEPGDLSAFAELRKKLSPKQIADLVVSGGADAALRLLSAIEAQGLRDRLKLARCEVITFGRVGWVRAQQVRVDVFDAEDVRLEARKQYLLLHHTLPPVPRPEAPGIPQPEEGDTRGAEPAPPAAPALEAPSRSPRRSRTQRRGAAPADEVRAEVTERYLVSPVLDRAARNLASGRPWWAEFARLLGDQRLRRQLEEHAAVLHQRYGQEGGLAAVVRAPSAFTDPGAEAIVRACHEAWHRRLGQLSEEAKRGRFTFEELEQRERERWRAALAGCRSLATLSATLTNFWARAGAPIPALQERWQAILPYLSETRWQQARDLALLALASYAGVEAPNETGTEPATALDGKETGA